jgi:hypothetical protein
MRGSRWRRARLCVCFSASLVSCASQPQSPALLEAREVRNAPASLEAEVWAPQAREHALGLEERAERELARDNVAAAEVLAEHAMAAHERAWVLTRLARAERRRANAEAERGELGRTLDELRAQQQRLSAEAVGVELRAQVLKGTLPARVADVPEAERREARRRAAEALALQGRLLCVGARMLGEKQAATDAFARLDALEQSIAGGRGALVLDEAIGLRASCLELISARRRERQQSDAAVPAARAPSGGAAEPVVPDMLLSELSALGVAPSRDDRGVGVTLRKVLNEQGALSDQRRSEIGRLVAISKSHPEFPVLLVGHAGGGERPGATAELLSRLASELRSLGVAAVEVVDGADRQPLLPPELPRARERNARVELIFVAPTY